MQEVGTGIKLVLTSLLSPKKEFFLPDKNVLPIVSIYLLSALLSINFEL